MGNHTPTPDAASAPRGQNLAALMQAVAQTMWAVQTGQSWQQAVADTPDALRPGVQALGFAVLRNWGRAQALCAELAAKPPPPLADALLTSALALLALPEPPYAPHTLLNETVQAAKAHEETSFQAGFINACLRRFLRLWVSAYRSVPKNATGRIWAGILRVFSCRAIIELAHLVQKP